MGQTCNAISRCDEADLGADLDSSVAIPGRDTVSHRHVTDPLQTDTGGCYRAIKLSKWATAPTAYESSRPETALVTVRFTEIQGAVLEVASVS